MIRYRLYDVHGVVVAVAPDLLALVNGNWDMIKADPLGMDVERTEVGHNATSGVVKYDPVLPGMVISWKEHK